MIHIGQDEPESYEEEWEHAPEDGEEARQGEEERPDERDDEEARRDQRAHEEAGQDQRDDEEEGQGRARQDSLEQAQLHVAMAASAAETQTPHKPEQTGAGDAAGRQDQPREHDGSTATSKPVDSRAEKEAQKNKDTPDPDVRSRGADALLRGPFGNQRPKSPSWPPGRQSATSEADGECLALNCHCLTPDACLSQARGSGSDWDNRCSKQFKRRDHSRSRRGGRQSCIADAGIPDDFPKVFQQNPAIEASVKRVRPLALVALACTAC